MNKEEAEAIAAFIEYRMAWGGFWSFDEDFAAFMDVVLEPMDE